MKRISLEQVINGERFFRVPKVLFELDFYKKMSSDSKLLYAILTVQTASAKEEQSKKVNRPMKQ